MNAIVKEVDFKSPCWDIPKMLRTLADSIEKGELGEVLHVTAVAYQGAGECEVYGFGPNLTPGMAYMALDVGKQRILKSGI